MAIPTRVNGEIIYAAHMNTLRDAVEALETNPITVTADYVAENTYRLIVADPESNSVEVTLPDATTNANKNYVIKTLETGATWELSFPVTVTSVSNIEGAATYTFEENRQSIRLISTGLTWVIV